MTIKSFEKLRLRLLANHAFLSFVHIHDVSNHPDIFGANSAFVIGKDKSPETAGTYVFLDASSSDSKAQHLRDAVRGRAPERVFRAEGAQFKEVPGAPLAFRMSAAMRKAFVGSTPVGDVATLREGINTGNNALFLRRWWEVSVSRVSFSRRKNCEPSARWVPHKKGGAFRKWAGNEEYLLDWGSEGAGLHAYHDVPLTSNGAPMRGKAYFFHPSLSWSRISTSEFSIRAYPAGLSYDSTAPSVFCDERTRVFLLGLLNSVVVKHLLSALSPTLDFRIAALSNIPLPPAWSEVDTTAVRELVELARADWDSAEESWNFRRLCSVPGESGDHRVSEVWSKALVQLDSAASRAQELEEANNRTLIEAYGLAAELDPAVPIERISLRANAQWSFPREHREGRLEAMRRANAAKELVSYAVGCMFGRYSLDEPGLILADQGATVRDLLAKVPEPTFTPDADNVIPIVDGDWFEDDIVARFRRFLRVAFGEQYFEENLRFITESLSVKDLRDYFVKSFYMDHVQRYKKRPTLLAVLQPEGVVQRADLHAPLHAVNGLDGPERVSARVQGQADGQPPAS